MDASVSLRTILRTAGRDGASQPTPRPFRLRLSVVYLFELRPTMGQPARLVTLRLAIWPAKRWQAVFESSKRGRWSKRRLGPFTLGFQLIDGRWAFDNPVADRPPGSDD